MVVTSHRTAAAGDALDRQIARLLTIGTYASVALIGIGVLEMVATGRSPLDAYRPLGLDTLVEDLAAFRPEGFLWLGLLAVIGTPAARVIASLVGYALGGERTMALVAAAVLAVVALGVGVGLGLRVMS
jgi:uncharacterized membrane protein